MKLRLLSLAVLTVFTFASCRKTPTEPTPPTPLSGGWTLSSSGTNQSLVVGQFVNSSAGFVGGETGVMLRTSDSGSHWSGLTPAPVFSGSVTGVIYGLSFFDASNGFVVGDQRDVDMTNDGGNTWNAMNTNNVPQTDLIRSLYFTSRNTGFIGTTDAYANPSGSICGTVDGGQTWNWVTSTAGGIYNIDFNIPGSHGLTGVAQGRYGVSYYTVDGGGTWNVGSTDQPNSLISRSTFTSATTGFAVAQSLTPNNDTAVSLSPQQFGFILRTDDAGHTWHTVYSTAHIAISLGLNGIANNGNGTITAVGGCGIVVESTDGGTTWTQSWTGSSLWYDIRYASQHHAVIFGVNGNIATRNE